MTDDRSLERAARSWLEDGPTRAPERAVDGALARIQTIPQVRAPWVPWRLPSMNPVAKLAAAAVVAAVAIGGSLYLFGGDSGFGGRPTPAPTATPSPTLPPLPSPTAATGACALLTSVEAAELAGDPGLGALPTASGSGDVTACSYRDGGGNLVVRLELTSFGGSAAYETATTAVDTEPVEGLGDAAAFDPASETLFVRVGDAMLEIRATGWSGRPVLGDAQAIAEVAVPRM